MEKKIREVGWCKVVNGLEGVTQDFEVDSECNREPVRIL